MRIRKASHNGGQFTMEHLRYVDFELNIEQKGDRYVARILRSPSGEASHSFELPFSEQDREIFVLKLGRLRGTTRRIYSQEMDTARKFGGQLFEAVFGGE